MAQPKTALKDCRKASHVGALFESQWFSISLAALFGLAWAFPSLSAALAGRGWTKSLAVVVIFLLAGFSLKTREAIRGMANWRLHVYVQGFSFGFLPLACWLLLLPFRATLPHGLLVGFYVLSVLPTTIATCVALTQLAGGSFVGALFNSVLANIAGIFIAPALLILMIGSSNMAITVDAMGTFLKLGRLILLPLAIGQLIRLAAGDRLPRVAGRASLISRAAVLLIVYLAFGETFSSAILRDSIGRVALPLALLIPAHLLTLWLANYGSRCLGFDRADQITATFCASQKTLALGLPLVMAMLDGSPELVGLASLPIIVWHPVQLLAAGLLVDRFRRTDPI